MWNFFCDHWKHQCHSNNRKLRDYNQFVLLILVQFRLQEDYSEETAVKAAAKQYYILC